MKFLLPKVLTFVIVFVAITVSAKQTLHTERSLYRNISVTQDRYLRCMVFETRKVNPPYQTCVDQRDKQKLVFSYTKLTLSGLLYNPSPKNILVIGLGGGTLPITLHQLIPEATITSVEIDPAVIKLAKQYFDYFENNQLRTEAIDGRLFAKRASLKKLQYDWIILDAFNGDYIPEHLMTQEFLQEIKSILTPDGIVTANTFSDSKLYQYESATYHSVFGDYYNVRQRNSGNRIILAANQSVLKTIDKIEPSVALFKEAFKPYGVDAEWLIHQFELDDVWLKDSPVLTDQYSPANLLKHNN